MNHVEFLNHISTQFDPDLLDDLPLFDALICAVVVIADYCRENFNDGVREQLVEIIRDDDRMRPDLIDTSDEGARH